MRFCIIGGVNADIIATTFNQFVPNDSNPGTVRLMAGGVGRNIAHNLALLGNETVFLSLFGGDTFGWFTADSCRKAKVDISLSDAAPVGTRSCFLSINNCDGEMIGGVSDMVSIDGITPEWIATKLQKVGPVDAFIADTNIPAESLAFLIDHAYAPLYVDAVSGAKAPKIRLALSLSSKKCIHTLKCNKIEHEIIGEVDGIGRRYVSLGSNGLDVIENGKVTHFPALPCQLVNANGAGDALMAGIALAGPQASIEEAARIGLRLAKITAECPETVNKQLKLLYEELS
jgi:pseudouridine kinase